MNSSDTVYFSGETLIYGSVAKYADINTELPTSGAMLAASSRAIAKVCIGRPSESNLSITDSRDSRRFWDGRFVGQVSVESVY